MLGIDQEVLDLSAKVKCLQINSNGQKKGLVPVGDAGIHGFLGALRPDSLASLH